MYGLLAKLDISISALTWLKKTLSLTYLVKRFAANFLEFDSIFCVMNINTNFLNIVYINKVYFINNL